MQRTSSVPLRSSAVKAAVTQRPGDGRKARPGVRRKAVRKFGGADSADVRTRAHAAGLVDAAAVADYLGVTRGRVYEHADELGEQQLGTEISGGTALSPSDPRSSRHCNASSPCRRRPTPRAWPPLPAERGERRECHD
jgi:hypothetical protein